MRNRADTNQNRIVKYLRETGKTVMVLSQVGYGCPDLLVGFRGRNWLFEVKGKNGRLSQTQQEWHELWRGCVYVVRTVKEVRDILGD